MFLALVASAVTSTLFDPPQPWALNIAPPPRIPLVGDVDGDGFDDLISVSPDGDAFIDVSLNSHGQKSSRPARAISNWAKNCQAAAAVRVGADSSDSVAGIFHGRTIRIAGNFKSGAYTDDPKPFVLPAALAEPSLDTLVDRKTLVAFSTSSGSAYSVDFAARKAAAIDLPSGLVWIGGSMDDLYGMRSDGQIVYVRGSFPPATALPKIDPSSRPAYGVDGQRRMLQFQRPGDTPCVKFLANVAGDGHLDAITFRLGKETHTANAVTLEPQLGAHGPTGSPSLDSSGDGLLDDWKINGYRGLDLKAMGCKPGQTDIVVFVAPFSTTDEKRFIAGMDQVTKFYANLPVTNRDGTKGWHFHPIYQKPIPPEDQGKSWWDNRDKYLPAQYRGVAHWMQVTPGGGGQADELGDGGGCGQNALWQVFVHELGHQIGMDHNGFWGPAFCPIYPSLMNYAYSYSLNDDGNQVSYSTGALSSLVLNETDLDETLPFPYDKVKFLSKGPYHYRLKPDGDKTLIDWDWSGQFGKKHVRAEINYSYATSAGSRDTIDKSNCAPWLFKHDGQGYALFGKRVVDAAKKENPTIDASRPGSLAVKRMIAPLKWTDAQILDKDALTGDPVAVDFGGDVYAFYQTPAGLAMNRMRSVAAGLQSVAKTIVEPNTALVPTAGVVGGRLYLLMWDPDTGAIRYRFMDRGGKLWDAVELDAKSTIAPGIADDTIAHQAVIGMAQDEDKKKSRWQIRRFDIADGKLEDKGFDWIEGKDGNAAGNGRCTLLFDADKSYMKTGRLYFYCQGTFGKASPWSCAYVAEQIGDKTVRDGWMVKRFYDEWTQTRSAPAAMWFDHDVLYAYRWVDGGQGDSDNNLQIGYHGLDITSEPMGDHDDLTYMKTFGIAYSIVYLQQK